MTGGCVKHCGSKVSGRIYIKLCRRSLLLPFLRNRLNRSGKCQDWYKVEESLVMLKARGCVENSGFAQVMPRWIYAARTHSSHQSRRVWEFLGFGRSVKNYVCEGIARVDLYRKVLFCYLKWRGYSSRCQGVRSEIELKSVWQFFRL